MDHLKDDLEITIDRIVYIKQNNVLSRINTKQIKYIKSEGNYCEIYATKKYVVKQSLTKLYSKIPQRQFLRIHKSYVVQLALIEKIFLNKQELHLASCILPLGPGYKDLLMKQLNIL